MGQMSRPQSHAMRIPFTRTSVKLSLAQKLMLHDATSGLDVGTSFLAEFPLTPDPCSFDVQPAARWGVGIAAGQAGTRCSKKWPWLHIYQGFFKENVRHPVWACRDPMIIFCDSRDLSFNSRDPIRVPKTPWKTLYIYKYIWSGVLFQVASARTVGKGEEEYALAKDRYSEVRPDWPHYTEEERASVRKCVAKICFDLVC